MFFLASVFPKLITGQATGMLCPSCGCESLSRLRLDHVLSLFTLPILTVRTGQAWLSCSECGWSDKAADNGQDAGTLPGGSHKDAGEGVEPPDQRQSQASQRRAPACCPSCGQRVRRSFLFCPYCGTAL